MKYVILLLLVSLAHREVQCRFTDYFVDWLNEYGDYGKYDFPRDDYGGLSFGGKESKDDKIINQPVIFIHGNTRNSSLWDGTRDYLINQEGYKLSELYATTWGIPERSAFWENQLDKKNIMFIRKFIEAVLQYTGADKIDIIAHSCLGVAISRAAIKGGSQWDAGVGYYQIGAPLTSKIDTYVGIAGCNQGGLLCISNPEVPVCNVKNGMYPGIMIGTEVVGRSELVENLLREPGFEGEFVYSIYGLQDERLKNGNMVYCQPTSRIPGQTGEVVFDSPEYTHYGLVYLTPELQHSLITSGLAISQERGLI